MDFMNILICLLIFIIIILCIWRIRIKNKCDMKMTEANIVALDRQFIVDIDDKLLDSFIERSFDEILILNIEYFGLVYVKESQTRELQRLLSNRVATRISPSLVNKMTSMYNKKFINKIIAEKCYMYVIAWAKEVNSMSIQPKKDQPIEYTMFGNNMKDEYNFDEM